MENGITWSKLGARKAVSVYEDVAYPDPLHLELELLSAKSVRQV